MHAEVHAAITFMDENDDDLCFRHAVLAVVAGQTVTAQIEEFGVRCVACRNELPVPDGMGPSKEAR